MPRIEWSGHIVFIVLSVCCQWMLILYNETETTNYLINYIKNGERSEPKIYQNLTFLSLNPAVYCNFVIFQISLKVLKKFRNLQEFRLNIGILKEFL